MKTFRHVLSLTALLYMPALITAADNTAPAQQTQETLTHDGTQTPNVTIEVPAPQYDEAYDQYAKEAGLARLALIKEYFKNIPTCFYCTRNATLDENSWTTNILVVYSKYYGNDGKHHESEKIVVYHPIFIPKNSRLSVVVHETDRVIN